METIAVDGAELAALSLGKDEAPAVVMLHGLMFGNMATWYSPIALPLAARRRVILYDQRGHGVSSPAPRGYDLDGQAGDLGRVLDHFDLGGPVDLVGHSMGALIALRFALTVPQRVRRLVLIDAPMPAAVHVGPSLLAVKSPEDLAAYLAATPSGGAGLRGRRRERLTKLVGTLLFETTLAADVMAMGAEADSALASLDRPVLLIYGSASPCRGTGERLARLIPEARLEIVAGGHYLTEEAPAVLSDHLDRFLQVAS
jgi:pimeloyl-ACP methyl ester carboxylesterase